MTPATFLPIIIMAILFSSMGGTIGGIEEELEEPPILAIINMDTGNYSEIIHPSLQNTLITLMIKSVQTKIHF